MNPWFRLALRLTGLPESIGFYRHLWDLVVDDITPDALQWRRFQVRIADLLSNEIADDATITFDCVNYTNGSVDASWTDADRQTVYNEMLGFFTWYRNHMQDRYSFTEIRCYPMAFTDMPTPAEIAAPDFKDKPFPDSGPPEDVLAINVPGNVTSYQAPQVSLTITEKTPLRRHWGRFYLPGPASAMVLRDGRAVSASITEICIAASDMYGNLNAAELPVVVPITQHDKQPYRALSTLQGISMDNVFDVIRRRRTKHATFRYDAGLTAGALPAEPPAEAA